MQKPNKSWSMTMWLLAGAGMGLVAAAATRWYWGLGAFVILALVTIASQYVRGSPGRPTRPHA
jgi:hypothetical protein